MDQIIHAIQVILDQLHLIMLTIQEMFGPMGTTGVLIGVVVALSLISTLTFNKSGASSIVILIPIAVGAVALSMLW